MLSNLFHKLGFSMALTIAAISIYCNAYSQPLQNSPQHNTDSAYNTTAYDQVVARPSLTQAPIAAVALAQINIALLEAKHSAEQSLCAGQWTPLGTLLRQQGSTQYGTIDDTSASKTSWHFNLLRHPYDLSCGTVSRARFFMEMSRHLPEWIQIRPAGQLTAFRRGNTILLDDISVALGGTPSAY